RPRANVSSRPFSVTQLRIRNGSYCPKATLPARSGNGEVGSKADSHKATPGRVLRYQALNKTRPGPGPPHLGAAATARLESRSRDLADASDCRLDSSPPNPIGWRLPGGGPGTS